MSSLGGARSSDVSQHYQLDQSRQLLGPDYLLNGLFNPSPSASAEAGLDICPRERPYNALAIEHFKPTVLAWRHLIRFDIIWTTKYRNLEPCVKLLGAAPLARPGPQMPRVKMARTTGPWICKTLIASTQQPCNITFSRDYNLRRHERAVHEGRVYQCQHCPGGKLYSRRYVLKRHQRLHHQMTQEPSQ